MRKQDKFTKTGRVRCNCGRTVKLDKITLIHPIDMNFFDWWMNEIIYDNKHIMKHNTKLIPKSWYGYIGYVPILKEIPYYIHKWFHRRKYILDIECKYCEKE